MYASPCPHMRTHRYASLCPHIRARTRMLTYTNTHVHAHMHTRTHTYSPVMRSDSLRNRPTQETMHTHTQETPSVPDAEAVVEVASEQVSICPHLPTLVGP